MALKYRSSLKSSALRGAGFAAALMCGLVFSHNASAQPDSATTQQLPDGMAQAQVPPSFPDGNQAPAAPVTQSPQVQALTPAQQTQARLQEVLNGTPTATEAAAAAAAQADGVPAIPADQPAADAVPAQPEQRRLVPATAMGADAARNADGSVANPVEAAAAVADAAQTPPAAQQDILERYTAQTNELNAQNPPAGTGDALPEVNTINRVRLEGSGFDNASGNVSTVEVDGSLSEPDSATLQEEIKTEAFDAAITGMFPLSPEQIQGLLKRYDATQKAAATPAFDSPKPEISVQNISLDPGVMPPVIKTAVGNVTTLNILDATGAPWPVQDVTWAGDYEIVEPEEGGHIIRITPMSHFARGNIVIRLLTLKTPLTLTLETGRDVVQYRVDARVPEYGPFANAPLMQGGKSMVAGSAELTSILDGVAPGGAMKLDVAGVDGRTTAYSLGGMTYVRTPLTLLSPAWQSSVSSADGMNVYVLSSAPVLLLSDEGEFTRAVLKEKEDLLDD